jgi:predicted ATPase/class 3 adenylate cyclase
MRASLPTGIVTFLFTDIEGSTKLVQSLGDGFDEVLNDHHGLMRDVLRRNGGVEVSTEGDAFFIAFESAAVAARVAVEMQRALVQHSWPGDVEVRVRMGMHTGEARLFGDNYGGLDVHRAARISSTAHGGQIVMSDATRALIEGSLPDRALIKDLGEHRLKDLDRPERLYQLSAEGLQSDFPEPRTLDARPNNLVLQLSPFVAREHELKEINMLLLDRRLVTLTGPGGTGKTRLAFELAGQLMHKHKDGAFVVLLSSVTDPTLVPSVIAETLGVRDEGTRPIADTLKDHLSDKELFLVLDNFEQIIEAASFVSGLVNACPRLRILVSSRGPLRVAGEQEYPVPPMSLPDPERLPPIGSLLDYEAIDLFVQRAREVDPSFTLQETNAWAVAGICRRLDGLPLAIELAAARLRLMSPGDLLKRLDKSLSVLTGGARDLSPRQRTLRGAIAWSYDLLDEPSQAFFRKLGIFSGGWSIDAVEPVADPYGTLGLDTFEAIEDLIDHSLIVRFDTFEGTTRFRMLQTIREFALETIEPEEMATTSAAHAHHFHDLAIERCATLLQEEGSVQKLNPEHDNIRAALTWFVEKGESAAALEMSAALWRFWQLGSHLEEGRRWLERALALPAGSEDELLRARAEMALGSITYWQNDWPATGLHYEAALDIYRRLNDEAGVAEALYNNGFLGLIERRTEVARGFYEQSLDLAQSMGAEEAVANAHWGLAMASLQERDYEGAGDHARIAEAVFEKLGNWWGTSLTDWIFLRLLLATGEHEAAHAKAIQNFDRFGDDINAASYESLFGVVADLFMKVGAHEQGVLLAGASASMKEAYGGGAPPALVDVEDPRETAKAFLSRERIAELYEEGKKLTLQEAAAIARKDPRSF